MAGKTKHYFAGGHTARGFYPLYESNLQGLDRIFILKGGPGTGKSTLIRTTGNNGKRKVTSSNGYTVRQTMMLLTV